jgi:hypothetical protein
MPERRTAAKLIRFQPEELARITERARACGQTPARFIRESALGAIPKPRHHAGADPWLCELARVGRALDQLVRLAHTVPHPVLVDQAQVALNRHWTLAQQILEGRRRPAEAGAR